MSMGKRLTGAGFAPLQAIGVVGDVDTGGVAGGATATGSTQATAYVISAVNTVFGTVAANTGAILPSAATIPDRLVIANNGANALTVYPPVGGYINALGQNAGYSLAANTAISFSLLDGNGARWYTGA